MDIEITIRVPVAAGEAPVVRTATPSATGEHIGPPDVAPPPAPTSNGSASSGADIAPAGTASEHVPPSLEYFGLAPSHTLASGDAGPPSAEMIAQAQVEATRSDDGASAPPDVTQVPSWTDTDAAPPPVDEHGNA